MIETSQLVPAAAALGLTSLRIAAWLIVVPPFNSRAVPAPAKGILSVALAMCVIAGQRVPTPPLAALSTSDLLSTAAAEITTGLAMGFITMLLLHIPTIVGSLYDTFGGFSVAQMFDPLTYNGTTLLGQFHTMLAGVLLFATGAHLVIIAGLLTSYQALPLGQALVLDASLLSDLFDLAFTTAVHVALPLLGVLFLADLALGMLTKAAPTMNAMSTLFPAKIGLTLLLLGATFPALPAVVEHLADWTNTSIADFIDASTAEPEPSP